MDDQESVMTDIFVSIEIKTYDGQQQVALKKALASAINHAVSDFGCEHERFIETIYEFKTEA